SPVTTPLTDYSRTGANRYGTPGEMDTVVQTLTLSQDKGFTKTLDRGNYTDSMMAISAANFMAEQIKGVVTPTVEKYGMTQFVTHAGQIDAAAAALTKSNVVEYLASGTQAMKDKFVPDDGQYLCVPASTFKLLSISPEFLGIDALGEKALEKGVVGVFQGAKVTVLPSSYFPENTLAMIARKESLLLPKKITTYKTHTNPPGIDGWLMEGRVYYDAFVVGGKADGVWVLCDKDKQQAAPTITYTGGATDTIEIASPSASAIRYTINGGDPRYDRNALTYGSAIDTSDWEAGDYVIQAVAYGGSSTPFTSDVTKSTVAVSDA
ncbi:MAG TPA: hypothetical protein DEA44_16685, partial [Firmicutes bacterium]|nr:hypothetical protein [Bacillota bacterium]